MTQEEQLDAANKVLKRIAAICTGALDPELSREQVIGRVKDIYAQAVSLLYDEDEEIAMEQTK